MFVSEIIDEVGEITGLCGDNVATFRAITRGVQMLANKGLFDPLIGYVDLTVSDKNIIALPAEVKTPLRININGKPSIPRSSLFEFAQNTNGTETGDENGYQWSDAGYSPVQITDPLPSAVAYHLGSSDDDGQTITITGRNVNGRLVTETIVGDAADPDPSENSFYTIESIQRETTTVEATLKAGADVVARYYPGETLPNYRLVRISKKESTIRLRYRKHVFKVSAPTDIILLEPPMAVILAAKAARLYMQNEYEQSALAMAEAEKLIKEEQASRDEHLTISDDVATATNSNIHTRDSIIVADVYDVAAEIFGSVSRGKLFDRMTDAIELLQNKAQWDASLGFVDVWRQANEDEVNPSGASGNGIFVLPRFVDAVLGVNLCGSPTMARNKWFEFHLNGTGERNTSGCEKYDDMGEVVTLNRIPLDSETREPIPQRLIAVPDLEGDEGTVIRVFGYRADGMPIMTDGELGMPVSCKQGVLLGSDVSDPIARIERITKANSTGFIKLYAAKQDQEITKVLYDTAAVEGTPTVSFDLSFIEWVNGVSEVYLTFVRTGDGYQVILSGDGEFGSGNAYAGSSPVTITDSDFLTATISNIVDHWVNIDDAVTYHITRVRDYSPDLLLGYYYPDEVEPKYRAIRLSTKKATRVRIGYRKRGGKVASLFEPVHLRSRLAIENAMRAIKLQKDGDPQAGAIYEALAVNYLSEERAASNPGETSSLQFHSGSSPFHNRNVQ